MIVSTLGAAHLTSALLALALGGVIVIEHQGTFSHRLMGAGYGLAMLVVNASALGLYRLTGHFGPFHVLALVSLASVGRGVAAVLRRRDGWLRNHCYGMAWSYVALLAAACAETVVRVPALGSLVTSPPLAVAAGVAIAALFTLAGALVLPRLQARAFASLG